MERSSGAIVKPNIKNGLLGPPKVASGVVRRVSKSKNLSVYGLRSFPSRK